MSETKELKSIAGLFLKLGITAFGGPAAHIAMMHNEVVAKRKWMSNEHYLDLVGATNLIPGPNSTEMAIHIGQERGGWRGLIIAGLCFILPAVIITGFFAWLYKEYGSLPDVQPFVYGIKPAIIAVILAAVYPLAKKSCKTVQLGSIACIVLVLSFLGFNEIYLMFGAGIAAMVLDSLITTKRANGLFPAVLLQVSDTFFFSPENVKIFWIFLKVGSILYGSGYVLFAFLDAELVTRGLLSRQHLIDAIAVGQFTPGPVFSSVTFIGYQMNGLSGAVLATIGIFLPSFIFVAFLNPLVKKMRGSKSFSVFLDAVNAASIAIIVAVCYAMGKETITDWRTVLIGVVSISLLFIFKRINSAWIVLGGSLAGYVLYQL
jgi:chromate transporter